MQQQKQKGFLMIAAVIIISILAILSLSLVSMYLRSTDATRRLQSIAAASALAESGLEQANSNLTQLTLSNRYSCAGLASATAVSLATGSFYYSSNTAPSYNYATLNTAIASNTTPATLTVNDTSVFTSSGWVLIGREVFQYGYIANSTTLGNVARAQDGSLATAHVVGELVGQYQCSITSTGSAPATNPIAIRQDQRGMRQPLLFAVGDNGTILSWNGPAAELVWTTQASGTTLPLTTISALNYHSAWALSNQTGSTTTISRLQGNTWSSFALSLGSNTNLASVDATSEQEAWAVGLRHGNNTNFFRWVRNATNDNGNWCQLPCPGVSLTVSDVGTGVNDRDLNGIKTYDLNGDGFADMGFAVGGKNGTGVILYFSGTGWTSITKAPLNYSLPANMGNQNAVDITRNGSSAPIEAFFVGQNSVSGGMLNRLRVVSGAASWTTLNPAQHLNAISVIDTNGDGLADFGCAVGDNGYVITFNSAMTTTITTLPGSPNLNSVVVISPTDVWIVGNGGVRYHYDGTSWVSLTNNVVTAYNLNGLSGIFPKQNMLSGWHELIN